MLDEAAPPSSGAAASSAAAPGPNAEIGAWRAALGATDLAIPWTAEDLYLYGTGSGFDDVQTGYRVDRSGARFPGWPEDWFVIGTLFGDAVIGQAIDGRCAVSFARHGAGYWKADRVANEPAAFAEALRIWCELYVAKYGRDVYDETDALRPDFLLELRQRVSAVLPADGLETWMDMVNG
ncbi:hypothetical protein [Burkholderia sp. Ac-20379]|uniref:hypothetical protein n=1 Tax=Burkholderia sp. Ac-20379 TaxID=2703900 RepID=UPI0019811A0D|nr:hypothetical protein [Burkholderia sp. Ac-20379]MBN3723657.1 hypothetical protein [Burkholderia sp. Ac-20379]